MGQTVISVFPCTAFCSLKVSSLFWVIIFSWNKKVLHDLKKKAPMNWTNQMNTLVFTLKWSFPDVQSNALYTSGPKVLKIFILPLYNWRSVTVAVFLAFIVYNMKKRYDFIEVSQIIQRLDRGKQNTSKNINLLYKSYVVWKLYILSILHVITKAEFVWME